MVCQGPFTVFWEEYMEKGKTPLYFQILGLVCFRTAITPRDFDVPNS